jgi:hypothetical protein
VRRKGGGTFILEQSSKNPSEVRGVTHYITKNCELSEKDTEKLESFSYRPTCVCAEWIRESVQQGTRIPTQNYLSTPPEPVSSVDQGVWEMGNQSRGAISRLATRAPGTLSRGSAPSANRIDSAPPLRFDPLLTSGVSSAPPGRQLSEAAPVIDLLSNGKPELPASHCSNSQEEERPSSTAGSAIRSDQISVHGCSSGGIFHGATFFISPRVSDSNELAEMIGAVGGKVLLTRPNLAEKPPDFDVRRFGGIAEEARSGPTCTPEAAGSGAGGGGFGRPKRQMSQSSLSCAGKIVSEYWVRKCIALGCCLDTEVRRNPTDKRLRSVLGLSNHHPFENLLLVRSYFFL